MEPKAVVARNVREYRQRRGWSQETLGDHCDMTTAEISRFEMGRVDLRVSTLVRLARGLEVSAADLLDGL